jgi:type I restriction enzyme, S subunit
MATDWRSCKLGDVIETLGGSTPSTKNPEYWEDGDITWYTPSDLTANKAMFIRDSSKKITQLGFENSSARMFPPYSVMMTSRATIGVIAINTSGACTNQGFITCIPNDRLSAYHIYFWIEQNREQINNIASGATYKEINRSEFRDILITVPNTEIETLFVEIVGPLCKQIETLHAKNANLRQTRDLLLPRLVGGRDYGRDVAPLRLYKRTQTHHDEIQGQISRRIGPFAGMGLHLGRLVFRHHLHTQP